MWWHCRWFVHLFRTRYDKPNSVLQLRLYSGLLQKDLLLTSGLKPMFHGKSPQHAPQYNWTARFQQVPAPILTKVHPFTVFLGRILPKCLPLSHHTTTPIPTRSLYHSLLLSGKQVKPKISVLHLIFMRRFKNLMNPNCRKYMALFFSPRGPLRPSPVQYVMHISNQTPPFILILLHLSHRISSCASRASWLAGDPKEIVPPAIDQS